MCDLDPEELAEYLAWRESVRLRAPARADPKAWTPPESVAPTAGAVPA